jgi:hypothetical protein
MSASSFIRRFVYSRKEGLPFTTRDCLHFGFRAAVDMTLWRLVERGVIRRLARGVFVKDPMNRFHFTDFEIAKLKAEAFGRKIALHPGAIAAELNLGEKSESIFSVDGQTSKFKIGDRTIHLKQCSPRKLWLDGCKAGHAMRALWQMGEWQLNDEAIETVAWKCNRVDKETFFSYLRWLPGWLNDSLKFGRTWTLTVSTTVCEKCKTN